MIALRIRQAAYHAVFWPFIGLVALTFVAVYPGLVLMLWITRTERPWVQPLQIVEEWLVETWDNRPLA